MGNNTVIILDIPTEAIFLGPHSLESGKKLIICPLSFTVKWDPVSVIIPLQETSVSQIKTSRVIPAWPSCSTKTVGGAQGAWGECGGSPGGGLVQSSKLGWVRSSALAVATASVSSPLLCAREGHNHPDHQLLSFCARLRAFSLCP